MKVVYKIGVALLALAIFPVLVFTPFVKLIVVSDVTSFFSSTPTILLDESYSLKQLYDLYVANKANIAAAGFSLDSLPETLIETIKVPGIVFVVMFAAALICAVLVILFGLFAKNRRSIMILSALGAAASFGINMSFSNIAKPLINGSVSIADLLGEELLAKLSGGMSAIGSALMGIFGGGDLVDIRLLQLSSAYLFMLMLFLAVIVWSVLFTLVDWDKQ